MLSCKLVRWRETTPLKGTALGGRERTAPLAQSAERLHGKEKVYGSIP